MFFFSREEKDDEFLRYYSTLIDKTFQIIFTESIFLSCTPIGIV